MSNQEINTLQDIFKLENLITRCRDSFELRYSEEVDFDPHRAKVDEGVLKAEISRWSFITLVDSRSEKRTLVFLTGMKGSSVLTMTSYIKTVDFERMAVITNSGSLYRLMGEPEETPLTVPHVVAIVATLNSWGFGPMLGLPEVFV